MRKTKQILGAVVVIAVALAFVLPSSAVVTNVLTKEKIDPLWIGKERKEIKEVKTWSKEDMSLPLLQGDNVQISGWAEGDDRRPAITQVSDGAIFVTYQNDADIFASGAGFAFSSDPLDQEAWFNNGVILTLQGVEIIYYPDTATCEHPDYQLMNVFVAIDTEEAGGMYIPDYTDYNTWEIYTWTNGAPEPELAAISDGGWYQDLYYDDVIGPFNFYIYHEIYDVYDIVRCPVFFHTGIDAESGVGFFDAQSFEKTAPASDPDYVNLPDRIHTCIYNMDTEKVIWKKIDPVVECDYEFTPFQATVADGTNPSIGAYDTNVAIVYAHEGNIKCVYSSDDGESWSQPVTIGPGGFPDVYAIGGTLYAGYVNNNNLYLITSEDNGATWSTPEQINDNPGSVVAEENCIDVHSAGIVWVDDRNDAYNIYYAPLPGTGEPPATPTATYDKKSDELTVTSTDPDGDQIRYGVSWNNDQNVDEWTTFVNSGTPATIDCGGREGTVGVIAEDSNGLQSGWTSVAPKNKPMGLQLLLMELFPQLYKLIQNLLQL
ncbi:MAG: hypothetical protein BV456_03720 [Thermoplasmata archaeon M8B2D]|nr:MAG: hypothetical protein BV456_03720 [Thermoplasmata archaeon M8B2D]